MKDNYPERHSVEDDEREDKSETVEEDCARQPGSQAQPAGL